MDFVKKVSSSDIISTILLKEVIVLLEACEGNSQNIRVFDYQLNEIFRLSGVETVFKSGDEEVVVVRPDRVTCSYWRMSIKQIKQVSTFTTKSMVNLSETLLISGSKRREKCFLSLDQDCLVLFREDFTVEKREQLPTFVSSPILEAYSQSSHQVYINESSGLMIVSADNLHALRYFKDEIFLCLAWDGMYFTFCERNKDYFALIEEKTRKTIWKKTQDIDEQIYPMMAVRSQSSGEQFVTVLNSAIIFQDIYQGKISTFDTGDQIDQVKFWQQGKIMLYYSTDTLYLMDVQRYLNQKRSGHQSLGEDMEVEDIKQYAAM